jgi:hypothetical protein
MSHLRIDKASYDSIPKGLRGFDARIRNTLPNEGAQITSQALSRNLTPGR